MTKKYALHPGNIVSRFDGDIHYIGVAALARLYELRPDEYIVWTDSARLKYFWEDVIHLFPREDGNYGRPDGESHARSHES